MTREEAKKYFWTDTKEFGESVAKKFGSINYQKIFSGYYIGREIDEFIDKIYDDFEEAMKPKTCNECEWWDFNSYGIFKKCFNGEGNCVSTKSSFGCNRFKQKDNA